MLALSSEQKIGGNSRPSPTLLSRPAKINARISNHRELCAASDNVGANCIPTAGLLPLSERFQSPWPGINSQTQARHFLTADPLSHGSRSGRLDFPPEPGMICCNATAWWVSLSL